jgi:hypothetical protein
METQKYSYSYLHCDDKNFNKKTIDVFKSNEFNGDDFCFYILIKNIYKIKIFKSNNLSINFSMMLFLSISLSSFNL